MNGKSGLVHAPISSLECERIRGAPKKSKAEIIINLVTFHLTLPSQIR